MPLLDQLISKYSVIYKTDPLLCWDVMKSVYIGLFAPQITAPEFKNMILILEISLGTLISYWSIFDPAWKQPISYQSFKTGI